MRARAIAALVLAGLCLAPAARAQDAWPSKTIRFVVAFAPGGSVDPIARATGQALSEKWKQSIVIENRPGGGGNTAAGVVARAEPDGYTVLVTTSAIAINISLSASPGYALSDFTTAAVVSTSPNIVIAAPALKQRTLPEILAAAKTEKFSFGSSGIGTIPHLSGEQIFRQLGKVDVPHVPFTGAGPAVIAVMGNHAPLAVITLPSAIEHVKAGTVKGVAVTTPARLPDLPDVPTVNEAGLGKLEAASVVAFFFPSKTPPEIVEKFNADMNTLLASGSLDRQFAVAGSTPVIQSRAEARAFIESEFTKWAEVIKAANIRAD